jgi:hypothetical protein
MNILLHESISFVPPTRGVINVQVLALRACIPTGKVIKEVVGEGGSSAATDLIWRGLIRNSLLRIVLQRSLPHILFSLLLRYFCLFRTHIALFHGFREISLVFVYPYTTLLPIPLQYRQLLQKQYTYHQVTSLQIVPSHCLHDRDRYRFDHP